MPRAYDYTNALEFHVRMLPGKISITENGTPVLEAQLTSIADTNASDSSPFTPTAQMIAQGPATALGSPSRYSVRTPAPGSYTQPVIVHAIIDEHGNARETEVLQSSSVSASALDFVGKMKHGQMKPAGGAITIEREVFINVQFLPAAIQASR